MKIAVVATGTELVVGQSQNTTSGWISSRFKKLGVATNAHLSVPDDRQLIRQALEFVSSKADLIFVTGGLGPTSDDFTREIVADWLGAKLVWHEESWLWIQRRLSERGVTVRESQRQQCYFPEGARILHNSQGTANGFYSQLNLHSSLKHVFVLPGPPREVEAIWNDQLKEIIDNLVQNLNPWCFLSWDTFGVPESEVAHRVEEVLTGFDLSNTKFDIGYRVHLPYVEAKIAFQKSEENKLQKLITTLDEKLNTMTVLKYDSRIDEEESDAAKLFVTLAKHAKKIQIYDEVTDGQILRRLSPHLSKINHFLYHQEIKNNWSKSDLLSDTEQDGLSIWVKNIDMRHVELKIKYKHHALTIPLYSQHNHSLLKERRRLFFAELTLLSAIRYLNRTRV